MSPAEWDGLVWWEQRLLVEGLAEEFSENGSAATAATTTETQAVDNTPGDFAVLGFREVDL